MTLSTFSHNTTRLRASIRHSDKDETHIFLVAVISTVLYANLVAGLLLPFVLAWRGWQMTMAACVGWYVVVTLIVWAVVPLRRE